MNKTDNNIIDYDINIMKDNIRRIMREKKITQQTLSEQIGVPQSQISDILSKKNSHSFTISQLVLIAKVLKTSTDDLLGVEPEKKELSEISLSDFLEKLFALDEICDIQISDCSAYFDTTDFYEESSEPLTFTTTGIYFKNPVITQILKEWGEFKAVKTSNKEIKEKIIHTWKTNILSNSISCMKKWDFRTKKQQGQYLAKELINHSLSENSEFPAPLCLYQWNNETVFEEYMDSGAYIMDFDNNNRSILEKYHFQTQNE